MQRNAVLRQPFAVAGGTPVDSAERILARLGLSVKQMNILLRRGAVVSDGVHAANHCLKRLLSRAAGTTGGGRTTGDGRRLGGYANAAAALGSGFLLHYHVKALHDVLQSRAPRIAHSLAAGVNIQCHFLADDGHTLILAKASTIRVLKRGGYFSLGEGKNESCRCVN